MKSNWSAVGAGLLLIGLGILALLQNALGLAVGIGWAAPFAVCGLVFLAVFAGDVTARWWAIIPGLSLLGLAALIALGDQMGGAAAALFFLAIAASFGVIYLIRRDFWWAVIPGFTMLGLAGLVAFGEQLGALGATLFLMSIALSFAAIYLAKRECWWAIIPAGAMASVAQIPAVAGDTESSGLLAVAIMFLGLAVTFGLVFLLSEASARRTWALIPAGIMAALGLLFLTGLGQAMNYAAPVILILVGGYLLLARWGAVRERG